MPLFKDTADFLSEYPYLESAEWDMLLPFLKRVERTVFRDVVLGHKYFDILQTQYTASIAVPPTAMGAQNAGVLARVRPALAFLTAHAASNISNVLHTSGGMMVTETENQKPAHMGRIRAAQADMLTEGYAQLNQLIQHLLEQQPPDWGSPLRDEVRESLVPTMVHADRYMRFAGPWLLHHMRPAMRRCQIGPVRTLLGETAYDQLVTAVRDSTTTPEQASILERARPAILYSAVASELLAGSVTIDADGVCNWSSVGSSAAVSGGKQPADKETLNGIVRRYEALADAELEALRKMTAPAVGGVSFSNDPDSHTFFGA